MIQDSEKVKNVLKKTFCFMQWQVDDANEKGEEVMGKEDIEFLLSLEGLRKHDVYVFETREIGRYDSRSLFRAIERAQSRGCLGLRIFISLIKYEDEQKIKKLGYFLKCEHGFDEIYFNEEGSLRYEISEFKHLFGSLGSVLPLVATV